MIWVTWRRLRGVLIAAALLDVLALVVALVLGGRVATLNRQFSRPPCDSGGWSTAHAAFCGAVQSHLNALESSVTNLVLLVCVGVVLVSAIIGATVVAGDFDRGTVRWAWAQSRSRRRWWCEVGTAALVATLVLAAPLTAVMSWFVGATQNGSRFGGWTFLSGGWLLATVAMATTALALAVGLVLRRPG